MDSVKFYYIMFVKLYYWNYSGDRRPQIPSSHVVQPCLRPTPEYHYLSNTHPENLQENYSYSYAKKTM
jgi:hypothetical protein